LIREATIRKAIADRLNEGEGMCSQPDGQDNPSLGGELRRSDRILEQRQQPVPPPQPPVIPAATRPPRPRMVPRPVPQQQPQPMRQLPPQQRPPDQSHQLPRAPLRIPQQEAQPLQQQVPRTQMHVPQPPPAPTPVPPVVEDIAQHMEVDPADQPQPGQVMVDLTEETTGHPMPDGLTEFQHELWKERRNPWFQANCRDNKGQAEWLQDDRGLWRNGFGKLVVPPGILRDQVLIACHDSVFSGHFGRAKTHSLVNRMFYWPYLSKEVQEYVSSCDICERVKPNTKAKLGGLRPLDVPDRKWSDVTVDMITALPVTSDGYDAILVFVDRLTKMTHFVPCKKTLDSPGFCQLFMQHVVRLHGWPRRLVSDRGSIFTSHFTATVAHIQGWLKSHSSAYHPESDGQTERMNRVLEDVLRSYVSTRQTE